MYKASSGTMGDYLKLGANLYLVVSHNYQLSVRDGIDNDIVWLCNQARYALENFAIIEYTGADGTDIEYPHYSIGEEVSYEGYSHLYNCQKKHCNVSVEIFTEILQKYPSNFHLEKGYEFARQALVLILMKNLGIKHVFCSECLFESNIIPPQNAQI